MHDFLGGSRRVSTLETLAERAAGDAAERFPALGPMLDVIEHELNELYEVETTPEGRPLPRAYHHAIEAMAETLAKVRLILADQWTVDGLFREPPSGETAAGWGDRSARAR